MGTVHFSSLDPTCPPIAACSNRRVDEARITSDPTLVTCKRCLRCYAAGKGHTVADLARLLEVES
jgi:hypothetical protein